jgi:putative heme-binding domain-containing protein
VPTADAAANLMDCLPRFLGDGNQLQTLCHHIARHGTEEITRRLLAFARGHEPNRYDLQVALYQAIEQGTQERGKGSSDDVRAWGRDIARKSLTSSQSNDVLNGIKMAGGLRLKEAEVKLKTIASQSSMPEPVRVEALKSLTAIDDRKHTPLIGRILADANEPLGLREQAAHTLARLNHQDALLQLVNALPIAPAQLQGIIAADLSGSRPGAEKLLEAVAAGTASARLLQEHIVEVRLAAANLPNLKARVAKLTEGLPPADQRMQQLFQRRKDRFAAAKTDPAQGAKVFAKSCANCHQLAGKGAKIGPQLDGVGIRGVDRLLEDLLDPNRNVDQAFRASTLILKDGQTIIGLVLREEGEVLVLADAQGKEVRVPKKNVEERSVSQQSPMPANLVDQISEPDFYHLLAFLLQHRAPKEGK